MIVQSRGGDYDNDRLDILLGGTLPAGGGISQVWRNNLPISNAPPAAPAGLSATVSANSVLLGWNASDDDHTPATGLNYNVRIGTTPGAPNVVSPMALTKGFRLLPAFGNAGSRLSVQNPVMNGQTYYWSVQAVDTSFAGSPFAAEQQFTIPPLLIRPMRLGNGVFQFSFTNQSVLSYEVLGTTNPALPVNQWELLDLPISLGGGLYEFNDSFAPNHPQRFYLLREQ